MTISLLEKAMRDSGKRKFLIDGAECRPCLSRSISLGCAESAAPHHSQHFMGHCPCAGFPRNEENRCNFESQVTSRHASQCAASASHMALR